MGEKPTPVRIPNVDTLADYIDRLIVEVNKLAFFENEKRREQAQPKPDVSKITKLDNASRNCCEMRSQLKNRINELFEGVLFSGEYQAIREVRTFRPPATRLSDAMANRCHDIGELFLRGAMIDALEAELGAD